MIVIKADMRVSYFLYLGIQALCAQTRHTI